MFFSSTAVLLGCNHLLNILWFSGAENKIIEKNVRNNTETIYIISLNKYMLLLETVVIPIDLVKNDLS